MDITATLDSMRSKLATDIASLQVDIEFANWRMGVLDEPVDIEPARIRLHALRQYVAQLDRYLASGDTPGTRDDALRSSLWQATVKLLIRYPDNPI